MCGGMRERGTGAKGALKGLSRNKFERVKRGKINDGRLGRNRRFGHLGNVR